jgi:hypothetical protein
MMAEYVRSMSRRGHRVSLWFVFHHNHIILWFEMPPQRTSCTEHSPSTKNRFIGRVLAKQKVGDAANAENIPPDTAWKILHKYRTTGSTDNQP